MTKQAKIRLIDEDCMPIRMSAGAAGFDLVAAETVTIDRDQHVAVRCGFAIALPPAFEAQIRPRSSSIKRGLVVPNSPGTIDSDYRGEVRVLLRNVSPQPVTVQRGDRIAQMVIKEVPQVNLVVVDAISDTERGAGGFGSTGK